MISRWAAAIVFCILLPFGAFSQDSTAVDYEIWESVASRAEAAVDTQTTSSEVFENLRKRIVDFRVSFDQARNENKDRIVTLNAQLEALGEVPAQGPEPIEISQKRREITEQLAQLQGPIQVAQAAYSRADGLIGEIDGIIRERQTSQLMTLGPSPLDPRNWSVALGDLSNFFNALRNESGLLGEPVAREKLSSSAPVVLLLLGIALLIFLRGGRAIQALHHGLSRYASESAKRVLDFIFSVVSAALPFFGVLAISQALQISGLLGQRTTILVQYLPVWAAVLLAGYWLSEALFPRDENDQILPISAENRRQARIGFCLLILGVVVRNILWVCLDFDQSSPSSFDVLSFPLILFVSIVLFRLGQILRSAVQTVVEEDGSTRITTISRLFRLCGLAAVFTAFVGPVMAAIGYGQASGTLVFSLISSFAVLGGVLVLHRFSADLYGWLSGQGVKGRDALLPVLFGILLLLACAPILALIWGVRTAELTDIWNAFFQGFSIGETRISPRSFIAFGVIFSGGYLLTRLMQGALRNNVLPKTKMDKGGQNAIVSGLGYTGIFVAALVAITGAGIDLTSLAFVAGALSVGIGFGLQNIVSNFVSGIILLIERPISEGDWIEVGGQHGYVRSISVRSTRIETFDRTDVIVPNADLVSGTVTNYTRGNTIGRLIVKVGVAYGSDVKQVEQILYEIAQAQPMVLANPAPFVLFSGFGADSLDFEIRIILRDINWCLSVQNAINHEVYERFSKEGIEIPFAQRDIWLRNPEAIAANTAKES